MKKYSPLFKRASSGKIYKWEIILEKEGDKLFLITENGFIDGKKVHHKREIKAGKASRTKMEQAVLEANSKWKAKKDKEGYVEDQNAIPTIIIRPMLASKYIPGKLKDFPVFIQPKFDGIRCMAHRDPTTGHIILESRTGMLFENMLHITKELRSVYRTHKLADSFYLDGELYTQDIPFEVLSGLVRAKSISLEETRKIKKIKFYIFDCFDLKRPDLTMTERIRILCNIFPPSSKYKYLVLSLTETINSEAEISNKMDEYLQHGYEGLMIRSTEGKYRLDKRSKDLKKYKKFIEEEFVIIGYHEGSGNDAGTLIWDLKTADDKTFSARPKGTREFRRKLLRNAESYIGKHVTVIFQEYTSDGIPRFPVGKSVREGF